MAGTIVSCVDRLRDDLWLAHMFAPLEDFPRIRETLWGLGCDSNWKLIHGGLGKGYAGKVTIPKQQALASIKLLYGDSHWYVYDAR